VVESRRVEEGSMPHRAHRIGQARGPVMVSLTGSSPPTLVEERVLGAAGAQAAPARRSPRSAETPAPRITLGDERS
jgi:hypothetical protein